jgi:hypothetical protein
VKGERTVRVEAIGKLWWPSVEAAFERSWKVGKGPFRHEIGSLAEAEGKLLTDSGDYSEIVDYRIIYVVKRTYWRKGVVGAIVHTRVKVARDWAKAEESAEMFCDLMYGREED